MSKSRVELLKKEQQKVYVLNESDNNHSGKKSNIIARMNDYFFGSEKITWSDAAFFYGIMIGLVIYVSICFYIVL